MRLSSLCARLCASVLLPLTLSCSRGEPTKQDHGRAPGSETDPASESRGAHPIASNSAVAAAEQHGTRLQGPLADNEGRNFEGRLQLRVTGLREPLQIRYLSRGERGRLQLEREGSSGFDAIFAGDQVIVLDHSRRRYRAQELKQVPKKS